MSAGGPGQSDLGPYEFGPGELNLLWAEGFVAGLVAAGVRTVVLAPGSRSTPLVLAIDAHPDIASIVHLDERSAAFLALGVGKASGGPAAMLTTSGTAVANLFPAVVEAAQSETPLLLLTADRPPRLRGTDANQTVDQERIFGTYPVAYHYAGLPSGAPEHLDGIRALALRAVTESLGPPSGPVHVNFPFDKPLQPVATGATTGPATGATSRAERTATQVAKSQRVPARRACIPTTEAIELLRKSVSRSERGLIVAGPVAGRGDGPAALARVTGFPLLADPLSGARYREDAADVQRVDHYDLFLRDPEIRRALRPDLVIRVGRASTSGALGELIVEAAADAADVVVVDAGGRWRDHTGAATSYIAADAELVAAALEAGRATDSPSDSAGTTAGAGSPWRDLWARSATAARAAVETRVREAPVLPSGAAEPVVTRAAARKLPPEGVLFASSSMPVRDIDAYVAGGRAWRCLGNRGASGIDGIASTALGACFATGRPTLVILGDLAFIHDLNGLIPAAELDLPVVFVVINNRGGGIFHMLPIREHEPAFTRYFATPHRVNFQHVGGLYDLPFRRIPGADVEEAVAAGFAAGGTHILEVTSDREENRRWRGQTVDAVRATVSDALALSQTTEPTKPENR